MVSYILREKNTNDEIYANSNSFISASFNKDVSQKIVDISLKQDPDLYLLNSNLNLNFCELLKNVVKKYNLKVVVVESKEEEKNWIMIDPAGYIPWEF
jgi:dTDP-4-dehydrorhamnose reductase